MAQGPPRRTPSDSDAKLNRNGATVGYEAQLWQMADALRGSMDAAEYKHVVLGLRRDGDVPVYGSNGQVGRHDERLVAGPGIVVGRKGTAGVVTWAPTDFFVIDTAFYVVPRAPCRSLHFLLHALQTHDLASLGADSAVPGLTRDLAYMSAQVVAPRPLLDRFDAYASLLVEHVHQCNEQSRTLAALRDTLLPKLLSGELRARDAARFTCIG
jgi:type I restriction enzyme, S subunit